jgi:hypothetical protein
MLWQFPSWPMAWKVNGTFVYSFNVIQQRSYCSDRVLFYICQYLEKELGMEALTTMKRIKAALDPNNIMNPGKLIPPHVCF